MRVPASGDSCQPWTSGLPGCCCSHASEALLKSLDVYLLGSLTLVGISQARQPSLVGLSGVLRGEKLVLKSQPLPVILLRRVFDWMVTQEAMSSAYGAVGIDSELLALPP